MQDLSSKCGNRLISNSLIEIFAKISIVNTTKVDEKCTFLLCTLFYLFQSLHELSVLFLSYRSYRLFNFLSVRFVFWRIQLAFCLHYLKSKIYFFFSNLCCVWCIFIILLLASIFVLNFCDPVDCGIFVSNIEK